MRAGPATNLNAMERTIVHALQAMTVDCDAMTSPVICALEGYLTEITQLAA
ncbi:hypothetical protein HPP92_007502 [Vanilla planifolia]|uniref:Uncharacterized protein n=1 Tax=Vanilla planifolia TaxID=51239 RepID=A0A835RG87_VANPL|nr:hypothetical protein HPP92_007502 [Vanilla planifolia]